MSFLSDLADAITRQEGYRPGTRAWRNNNPGNLWDGLGAGKTKRIFPTLPVDEAGYLIFPTAAAGRAALERDLSIKVDRGMTLRSLITMYAPPSENPTEAYVSNVAGWLGIGDSIDLREVAAVWPVGLVEPVPVAIAAPAASSWPAISDRVSLPAAVVDGAVAWPDLGPVEMSPGVAVGVGVGLLVAVWLVFG